MEHMHPQIASVVQSEAFVAGTLEHFDDAWTKVERKTGCTIPFNSSCGLHCRTDKTSHNLARTVMEALVQTPKTAKLLKCSILLPDYACFDKKDWNFQPSDCVPEFASSVEDFTKIME